MNLICWLHLGVLVLSVCNPGFGADKEGVICRQQQSCRATVWCDVQASHLPDSAIQRPGIQLVAVGNMMEQSRPDATITGEEAAQRQDPVKVLELHSTAVSKSKAPCAEVLKCGLGAGKSL